MQLTWRWFFGASILVAGLLLKMGAPPATVAAMRRAAATTGTAMRPAPWLAK